VGGKESAATFVFLADFPAGGLVAVGGDQLIRQADQQGRSFQLAIGFVLAQVGGDIPPSQEVEYNTCAMDFLAVDPHEVQILIAEVALLAAFPSVSAHLDHGFLFLFKDVDQRAFIIYIIYNKGTKILRIIKFYFASGY
jgi:hypothetical protein